MAKEQPLSSSEKIKKQQQRNLWVLIIIVGAVGWGALQLLSDHQSPKKVVEKVNTEDFATAPAADAQNIWVERAQNQLAQQTKTTDTLTQQLQLLQQNKSLQEKSTQQQNQQIVALKTELSDLKIQVQSSKANVLSGGANGQSGDSAGQGDGFINEDTLQLTPRPSAYDLIPAKNPDNFVPSGTFVRALTLGGADASAAVTSQTDPSPMLFRILDKGTLPNHRFSHLKDCVATAAAAGDISSERGQIRLERLSCTQSNGQIIELPVEATVYGPDGKNGVRGIPLWREGALLTRAFAAGTLSGLSNGIAQSYTTNSISPLGATTTVDNGKIFQYGVASGVGNAANKLADYNIQRAEQYHPVIQLSAGTVVDIVFLKGFYLDGKKHTDNEAATLIPDNSLNPNPNNETPTLFTTSTLTNSSSGSSQPTPLPLTSEQIQILQQKNAQFNH